MAGKTALITGSSGLIGSEAVTFLDERGWTVHGIDNNMRRVFFGPSGDTTWNLERLRRVTRSFCQVGLDIRDRQPIFDLFRVEWERTALARAVALAVLRYRNDHQLSQRDLAHKLDWKQPAVARLESGEVNPALETLYQLASRLRLHFIVQVAPTRQRHIVRGARRGEVVERVRTSEGSHVLVAAG